MAVYKTFPKPSAVDALLGPPLDGYNYPPMMKHPPFADNEWRRRAIGIRMHWIDGSRIPFDILETHYTEGSESVHVLVFVKDEPVVLKDPVELFPSDTLITQLRLLEG